MGWIDPLPFIDDFIPDATEPRLESPHSFDEYLRLTRDQEARDKGRFTGTIVDPPIEPPVGTPGGEDEWHPGAIKSAQRLFLSHGYEKLTIEVEMTPSVLLKDRTIDSVTYTLSGASEVLPEISPLEKVEVSIGTAQVRWVRS